MIGFQYHAPAILSFCCTQVDWYALHSTKKEEVAAAAAWVGGTPTHEIRALVVDSAQALQALVLETGVDALAHIRVLLYEHVATCTRLGIPCVDAELRGDNTYKTVRLSLQPEQWVEYLRGLDCGIGDFEVNARSLTGPGAAELDPDSVTPEILAVEKTGVLPLGEEEAKELAAALKDVTSPAFQETLKREKEKQMSAPTFSPPSFAPTGAPVAPTQPPSGPPSFAPTSPSAPVAQAPTPPAPQAPSAPAFPQFAPTAPAQDPVTPPQAPVAQAPKVPAAPLPEVSKEVPPSLAQKVREARDRVMKEFFILEKLLEAPTAPAQDPVTPPQAPAPSAPAAQAPKVPAATQTPAPTTAPAFPSEPPTQNYDELAVILGRVLNGLAQEAQVNYARALALYILGAMVEKDFRVVEKASGVTNQEAFDFASSKMGSALWVTYHALLKGLNYEDVKAKTGVRDADMNLLNQLAPMGTVAQYIYPAGAEDFKRFGLAA